MRERECVCERERESVCVCVCMRVSECVNHTVLVQLAAEHTEVALGNDQCMCCMYRILYACRSTAV